jgi:predicted nucleic acid-binding protein
MTAAVFVDTNVFVYARDASEGPKQSIALVWLQELWTGHRGRTSTQVLNEYYVTTTRKLRPGLDPARAWEHVRALFAWEPQAIDSELLAQAREIEARYKTSWWDSMIVAAAHLQDCAVLLSEDFQHGAKFGAVQVRNPFVASVSETRSEYEAPRLHVKRHRPRGRPRAAGR